MQALLIVGGDRSIFGGLASRQKIEAIAANKFQSIVKHKLFGYIPAIIFANVIARCDLNVQKEMDVVDAGILWIWHQKRPLINTLLVFSRIRSTLLSPGDFNTIQERLKTLPNGEKARLIPIIMTTLWSTFCHRCCIIKEHIEKSMMRCGVPNPSDDAAVDLSKLPLSKEDHEKLKAKSKEKDDDLSKSTQLASKSQKSKSSKKSEESEKSWSTRRSKEDKSRKRDSRSRKLRRAMRKKFCNSKTAPG
uniref:BACK domain-containing protein n=1 Tax=Setaria digitata TaxID=48799 RepID=A0A915PKY4_9BILA